MSIYNIKTLIRTLEHVYIDGNQVNSDVRKQAFFSNETWTIVECSNHYETYFDPRL